jgi:VIT1/CCC1 family predicted Fe2+/Mn2+ transporter
MVKKKKDLKKKGFRRVGFKNLARIKYVLRDLVFGMEDGLVSNLGLILGVFVGGATGEIIILAGLATMFTGAFSMSAGSYLSAKSQREVYLREINDTKFKLKKNPRKCLLEMKKILEKEGFDEDEVLVMITHFDKHNHKTFLTNYIQKIVGLSEDRLESPLKNSLMMFVSFFFGSFIPVVPFLFLNTRIAMFSSVSLTIISLFVLGITSSIFTKRSMFKSGLEILIVGLGAGIIGYIVGSLFAII